MPSTAFARLRGRTARPEEVAVVQAFLCRNDDPRGAIAAEQVAQSRAIKRSRPSPSEYLMRPAWTSIDLDFDIPYDVRSEEVAVRDAGTGRELVFSVECKRGGFFGGLYGRTRDGGRWPRRWRVADEDLRRIEPLELPPMPDPEEVLARLRAWLGVGRDAKRGYMAFRPPAGAAAVEELERREEHGTPPGFREFVAIADGFSLGGAKHVYGSDGAYVVELEEEPWWVLGYFEEDHIVARAGDDTLSEVLSWPHDVDREDARRVGADFPDFVRRLLFKR